MADPLAGSEDVELLLGRTLTTAEEDQVAGLLASASTRVRAFCKQTFSRVDDDQVTLRPLGTTLRLRSGPVISIAEVAAVGPDGTGLFPVVGWHWDGIDRIDLAGLNPEVFVSLPAWWDQSRGASSYRVTYTHGHDTIPPLIIDVVANAAIRVLNSPSAVEGSTMQTIGQYSEQFQQSQGAPGRAVRLTAADRQALIDAGYRRQATTVQLRA